METPLLNLHSKLPQTGTTIFTVMSALANKHHAINLSQGFPDFSCSPELVKLVTKYMRKGYNQYAPMQGIFPLREKIAAKIERLYSATVNPETEINITSGATEAIFTAITAIIREGDEVIVFEPAYDCYVPAIRLNGGIPVFIEMEAPEYTINWEAVKNRINSKTRMILVNTPHNPTGAVWNAFDMMQLEKLTKGTDIIILSDEVYEHIIFDGLDHQSVLRFPKLFQRSIVVFSFGKTYHNTGWKVGYCLAPEPIMKELRKVHQFVVFTTITPVQYAIADFMDREEEYLGLSTFYQQKRDFFNTLVKDTRFTVIPSKGTYFQLLGYNKISNEDDVTMAKRLTIENGIASVPISVLYNQHNDNRALRFCFAKSNETLEKAVEKLMKC